MRKTRSKNEKDDETTSNNSEAETNGSIKISEKSINFASYKSDETNSEASTKSPKENPPENQLSNGATQLTKSAAEVQSKTKIDATAVQVYVSLLY